MKSKFFLPRREQSPTFIFALTLLLSHVFPHPSAAMMTDDSLKELGGGDCLKSPFIDKYLQEMSTLHWSRNKLTDSSIAYVFVLSGQYSYLKNVVDGPEFEDREDDYNRIEFGITQPIQQSFLLKRIALPCLQSW